MSSDNGISPEAQALLDFMEWENKDGAKDLVVKETDHYEARLADREDWHLGMPTFEVWHQTALEPWGRWEYREEGAPQYVVIREIDPQEFREKFAQEFLVLLAGFTAELNEFVNQRVRG